MTPSLKLAQLRNRPAGAPAKCKVIWTMLESRHEKGVFMRQIIFSTFVTLSALLVAAKWFQGISNYGRHFFTQMWEQAEAVGGPRAFRARLIPVLSIVSIAALMRAYSRLVESTYLTDVELIGSVLLFIVTLVLFFERGPEEAGTGPDEPSD
jgi:hypothetical protein